jgi:hypothetical protein
MLVVGIGKATEEIPSIHTYSHIISYRKEPGKRKTANLKISYILRSKNIICGLSPKEEKTHRTEEGKKIQKILMLRIITRRRQRQRLYDDDNGDTERRRRMVKYNSIYIVNPPTFTYWRIHAKRSCESFRLASRKYTLQKYIYLLLFFFFLLIYI